MTDAGENKNRTVVISNTTWGMAIKQMHAYISDKVLPILKP